MSALEHLNVALDHLEAADELQTLSQEQSAHVHNAMILLMAAGAVAGASSENVRHAEPVNLEPKNQNQTYAK